MYQARSNRWLHARCTFPTSYPLHKGYIDVGHRLRTDPRHMAAVFAGKVPLKPRPGDLSYFNWLTGAVSSSDSADLTVRLLHPATVHSRPTQVTTDEQGCLCFHHNSDGRCIRVGGVKSASPRIDLGALPGYAQAVIFDHQCAVA